MEAGLTMRILSRLATAIILIIAVSIGAFVLLDLSPGDKAVRLLAAMGETNITDAKADALRTSLGLDAPVWQRYLDWAIGALRGDFGRSFVSARPVADLLGQALPLTLLLTLTSTGLTFCLALIAGTYVGLHPKRWFARVLSGATSLAYAIPGFVVALVLLAVFAISLGLLPAGGVSDVGTSASFWQVFKHMILPVTALTFGPLLAVSVQVVAATTNETLRGPHVEAAHARGLPRHRVLVFHIIRNSLIPLVAQFGVAAAMLVQGAFVVEIVFGWPGLGTLLRDAALAQDFPVIAAVAVVSAVIVVAAQLLAEMVILGLDPRQRRLSPTKAVPA